jgi:hypothetical protein
MFARKSTSSQKHESVRVYITSDTQAVVHESLKELFKEKELYHFVTRHLAVLNTASAAVSLGAEENESDRQMLRIFHVFSSVAVSQSILESNKTFLTDHSTYYLDKKKMRHKLDNQSFVPPQLAFDLLKLYSVSGGDTYVMDFHCGTGSFAFISLLQSYNYWGCDKDIATTKDITIPYALKYFKDNENRGRDFMTEKKTVVEKRK